MERTDAEVKIIKGKTKLMREHVGLASMLMPLEFVQDDDQNTMATDGKKIFWAEKFVEDTDLPELMAVFIHEVLHVVYEHPYRRGDRDPKLWNVACDYAINNYIIDTLRLSLPQGGLYSYKYRNMTAEQIYRILDTDDDAFEDMMQSAKSTSLDESLSGESNQSKSGNKYEDIPTQVGEVLDATDEDGNPLSKDQIEEAVTAIRQQLSTANKVEALNGTSDLKGVIESNSSIRVDWVASIADWLQDVFSYVHSYKKPNKRHLARDYYLPSKVPLNNGGELAVAIDTSGSICQEELNYFGSILEQMCLDLNISTLRVCYCDTIVRKNEHGEWWDTFDVQNGDPINLIARGGGGTDFNPPFNLFKDYSDDTENVCGFIYFTDGYGSVEVDQELDIPTLWAITDYQSSTTEQLESYFRYQIPFGDFVSVDISQIN